ncbi:hypothetical protein TruAng_001075 [Truncatella angustata]|nr:hypothetical protein TruAng_001075 [Truncatella angustata]
MASDPPSSLKLNQPAAKRSCSKHILECLASRSVPFIVKNDPDWKIHASTFNTRLSYEPLVIITPKTFQHISEAIICASNHGIHVQAKCGGHSYPSFSNGGIDGMMIVHLQNFRDVEIDQKTGIAKVGGGTRLGPSGLAIWNQALDQIVGLDVILADGSLIHANQDQHSTIFYAMRGAADMIGIAVNFYLQTHPAPKQVVKWDIDLSPSAPIEDIEAAADTFLHLQAVSNDASVMNRNISFGVVLGPGTWFNVGGTFLGSLESFKSTIAPALLQDVAKPKSFTMKELSWIDALKCLAGDDLTVADTYKGRGNFYAKSVTIPQPDASRESVISYIRFIASTGQKQSFGWYTILDLYGGAGSQINRKDQNFAAYGARDTMWVAQHQASVDTDKIFPREGINFLDALNKSLTNHIDRYGAYLPYVDSEYDKDTASRMYYGDVLYKRLKAVKRQVDPQNVFANPQSIDPEV